MYRTNARTRRQIPKEYSSLIFLHRVDQSIRAAKYILSASAIFTLCYPGLWLVYHWFPKLKDDDWWTAASAASLILMALAAFMAFSIGIGSLIHAAVQKLSESGVDTHLVAGVILLAFVASLMVPGALGAVGIIQDNTVVVRLSQMFGAVVLGIAALIGVIIAIYHCHEEFKRHKATIRSSLCSVVNRRELDPADEEKVLNLLSRV